MLFICLRGGAANSLHLAALALTALLAGCAMSNRSPVVDTPASEQMHFALESGVYLCEEGNSVDVQREARNADLLTLRWQGQRYTLLRYDSNSGLPRFEDKQAGLVWLDLPWKSMLMDARSGKPLASDCKVAQG